jgi:hypothetical protein
MKDKNPELKNNEVLSKNKAQVGRDVSKSFIVTGDGNIINVDEKKSSSNSQTEDPTPKYQKTITWIIATIVGMLGIVISLNAILPKNPAITVQNKLVLPIVVTVKDAYPTRIMPGKTATITLFSGHAFPVNVKWVAERKKNSNGQLLGEELKDEIELVDAGKKIIVDNEINLVSYFYPVVLNNTDSKCTIVINDGLNIEYIIGTSNPHRLTNITGYYKYATNSNVTLKCADQIYWLGKRNGKASEGKVVLSAGSGVLEVEIP